MHHGMADSMYQLYVYTEYLCTKTLGALASFPEPDLFLYNLADNTS